MNITQENMAVAAFELPYHTKLSMRKDSKVDYRIIAQETLQTSEIPTGYVHVQPAERAERPPFWYQPLQVPFTLFALKTSCGSRC